MRSFFAFSGGPIGVITDGVKRTDRDGAPRRRTGDGRGVEPAAAGVPSVSCFIRLLGFLAVIFIVGVGGCSSGGATPGPSGPVTFPPDALLALPSASGRLSVAVRTSPQPPVKGVNAVQFRITDAAGVAVDGAGVVVVPWMPSHGHGTSVRPLVEAEGDGVYTITNVYLYMDGQWQLRSTLSLQAGDAPDSVTPVLDVP